MMTRAELQGLAQVRLDDAVFLLNAQRSSSAYYLGGYAVELGLKACISRQIHSQTIPGKSFINAIYTHDLDDLLGHAGLKPQFATDAKADSQFAAAWAIVNNWNEGSRYESWDVIAATTLLNAIRHPQHGVFEWLKRHW